MIDKRILYINESQMIGIKYNYKEQICTIGGLQKFQAFFEYILKKYFKLKKQDIYNFRLISWGKIKYSFLYDKIRYRRVLKRLCKDHFVIEKVKAHKRIMR